MGKEPDDKGNVPKNISINNELAILNSVLTFARDKGITIPTFKMKRLPVAQPNRTTAWSDKEVKALFGKMKEHAPTILPLVVFLANTGCRETEAIVLPKKAVDLERRLVKIWTLDGDTEGNGNGDGGPGEWSPKWHKQREVPISDALLPFLKEQLRTAGPWLFPCRKGTPYKQWPHDFFDQARKAAGLKGGPHTLRHTYASHFLASTPDLFLLAKVMGHSHGRVTELYAHLLPDHLAKARNAVRFSPSTATPKSTNGATTAKGTTGTNGVKAAKPSEGHA